MKKRVTALAAASKQLTAALAQREPSKATSPQLQRDADTAVDGGWSATHKWLLGWSLVEDEAGHHAVAQKLLDILFPDGLRFTQAAFDKEWAEVKWRLARIESDGLAKHFAKLGGAAFLDRLHNDHKAYGDALGITGVAETVPETVLVREPLLAARKALRSFVLLSSAHAEDNPDEEALVERILRPLASWQGPTRPSGDGAPIAVPPAVSTPSS